MLINIKVKQILDKITKCIFYKNIEIGLTIKYEDIKSFQCGYTTQNNSKFLTLFGNVCGNVLSK